MHTRNVSGADDVSNKPEPPSVAVRLVASVAKAIDVAVVTGGVRVEHVPLTAGTRNTLDTDTAEMPLPATTTTLVGFSAVTLAGTKRLVLAEEGTTRVAD